MSAPLLLLYSTDRGFISMHIRIDKNSFWICDIPAASTEALLVKETTRGSRLSVTPLQVIAEREDSFDLEVAFADFNFMTERLFLSKSKTNVTRLCSLFDKFRIDLSKADSHHYMTTTLLGGPSLRKFGEDDLFYVCICLMRGGLPETNEYYGGLFTLLAFRTAEHMGARRQWLPEMNRHHAKYRRAYVEGVGNATRWLISSSLNLAIVNLYADDVDGATEIVRDFDAMRINNFTYPLTYMNYCGLLFLNGLLKFGEGKEERAQHLFSEAAGLATVYVSQLFSLRNEYLFGHVMDSEVLLKLGYAAFRASAALSKGRYLSDSLVLNMKFDPAKVGVFDVSPLVTRYLSILKRKPAYLQIQEARIEAIRKGELVAA